MPQATERFLLLFKKKSQIRANNPVSPLILPCSAVGAVPVEEECEGGDEEAVGDGDGGEDVVERLVVVVALHHHPRVQLAVVARERHARVRDVLQEKGSMCRAFRIGFTNEIREESRCGLCDACFVTVLQIKQMCWGLPQPTQSPRLSLSLCLTNLN